MQKKGKTWWGCCPFHFEKTPSFAINEYEQYYHCFGCGASGDVIKFVEKIENCDFYDACVILAKNANMEIPEFTNDENVVMNKKKKERALKVLNDTARYYFKNLNLPQAKPALAYIEKRKLDIQTVKTFGIGYSLGWDELITYLKGLGYSIQEMIDAGVIEKRANSSGYYDPQCQRLVFLIINSFGDVVGFSARLLENADFAKYKNTAQTIVFDKSKCVYNINNIKKLKQKNELDEVIIVEGQMDVISLYKNGVKNAVACLGTALTPQHAKEIKKFSDKVVVCFDGDGAGKKATLRSLEILVKNGLSVYVASLPAGVDPDEFVLKYGENLIQNAKFWIEYLIYYYSDLYNINKVEEKTKFIKESLNVVKQLQTQSEQEIYLKIISNLANVSISVLKNDIDTLVNAQEDEDVNSIKEQEYEIKKDNAYVKAVVFVLASLLHKKEYAYFDDEIPENIFNPDYVQLYNYMSEQNKNNKRVLVSSVFDLFEDENNIDIYNVINYNFIESEENESYYKDCIKILMNAGLAKKQKDLMQQINATSDLDERRGLRKKLQEITIKIKGN